MGGNEEATTVTADEADARRRGLMLVLSSPSGAGKSTIARQLLAMEKESITLSISVTTRPRRSSEIEGVHYYFISQERFQQMRERDELLEWAEVHGNFYGTPRDFVENALERGKDVLFDIDIQGTFQLYEKMRSDVASIFILPPSIAEMKSRLHRRAEDTEDVIMRRLQTAVSEMRHWSKYDYIIVNEDLERAFNGARAILHAERLKRERSPVIGGFIDGMVRDLERELSKSKG